MPTLRITVSIDVDDVPIATSPIIRRISPAESQPMTAIRATSASFVALPTGEMTTNIQALILQADQTVAIGVNNSATNPITLNPGGVMILFDCNLTGGSPLLQNNSGQSATVRTLIAGS
jgi:hypothetical protein